MLVNVNIGHQHPKVVEAIKAQADILTTVALRTHNRALRPAQQWGQPSLSSDPLMFKVPQE
jgi:4-aminobutyrate aminotransferase-like enzyme